MRILLDECVPRPLKRELTNYKVRTVVEMKGSGIFRRLLTYRQRSQQHWVSYFKLTYTALMFNEFHPLNEGQRLAGEGQELVSER